MAYKEDFSFNKPIGDRIAKWVLIYLIFTILLAFLCSGSPDIWDALDEFIKMKLAR